MNRTVLIGALVVVLAVAGYYAFAPNNDAPMGGMDMGGTAPAADAPAPAAGTAPATEAAPAAPAAPDAAPAAPAADTAAGGTPETAPAVDAATVLDPANFDPEAVKALINGSTLPDASKAPLIAAVDAAAANPAQVESTLATVRSALGL